MKTYPSVPDAGSAPPELFEGGHLWIQEYVAGGHLRFQLRESGVVRFGDRRRTFEAGEEPPQYGHAVRHVRSTLDRAALRSAVDDVESVVFFGEATHRRAVDYEWHRTPSVLGFDVWDADRGEFRPPDAVEQIFDRLGLQAVNAFRKEVRASDFDPSTATIPDSAWRDGPAAGMLVRSKTGGRAKIRNPEVAWDADPEPLEGSPRELADRFASDRRLRRLHDGLETEGRPPTFDALYDRVIEEVLRAAHDRLLAPRTAVDLAVFRSAVAARTREWLDERG